MFGYVTLTNEDEIKSGNSYFELSALIDDGGEGYSMPCLCFYKEIRNMEECWDNDMFLMNEVYPYLCGMEENVDFDKYFGNYKQTALEMFNRGIKLGFFKKTGIVK